MRWTWIANRLTFIGLALAMLPVSPRLASSADTGSPGPAFGDDRFAVTMYGDPQQLITLGTRWFITYTSDPFAVPTGAVWVQYANFGGDQASKAELARRAAMYRGSYW